MLMHQSTPKKKKERKKYIVKKYGPCRTIAYKEILSYFSALLTA